MSDVLTNLMSGLVGGIFGGGASYIAAWQSNKHSERLAVKAWKRQESKERAAGRRSDMAAAWRVMHILQIQIAAVRGLHTGIERAARRGEKEAPGADLYQVLLPNASSLQTASYGPDDLGVFVRLGKADIIPDLMSIDSGVASVIAASEKYSELRFAYGRARSEVDGDKLTKSDMDRLAPMSFELKSLADLCREFAKKDYEAGISLIPKLTEIFGNAFGDLSFPKFEIKPINYDEL